MTLVDVNAAVQVLGVQFQQDELFPEYNCIWHDKDYPTSCSGTNLGGNVHVYLKNIGASLVTIKAVATGCTTQRQHPDVDLAGMSRGPLGTGGWLVAADDLEHGHE